ncbi:MetQ/NlpA family ABC transporter substrate-binding protein [Brachyspira innocens]|uniref:MetQ/NlpA family ABC transporter substrate-binding protein n=1 Tax=Brachyspira innocens TaxID=13264 RepID=UPI0026EFAEA3|nr:MetQ/NlpA family ABC transporter substrate-binding protein [Brachyspira innocens]
MNIKNILKILLLLISCVFISCSDNKDNKNDKRIIKIALVGASDTFIWKPIIEKLNKDGIKIELVDFYDYDIPNRALNDGEVDLNAFQHHAYFDNQVKENGYNITPIADTYISAMNIHSKQITNINQIKEEDTVVIPKDPSNTARALKVLQAAGIIKLKEEAGDFPSTNDIIDNLLNIKIMEVKSIDIYSVLNDVACAVINANYAMDMGLNQGTDYIFQDDPSIYSGNSFINLIAARTKDKNNPVYKKIVETYQSSETEKVYEKYFKGAYLPAWK